MNANRLGTGATIAAVAAVVLLISMFLGWFKLDGITVAGDLGEVVPGVDLELTGDELEAAAESAGEDTSASAWQAFGLIDILLALAAAAGLALAFMSASVSRPRLPVSMGAVVAGLGTLAAVLILFRIISPPDLVGAFGGAAVPEGIDVETDVGRNLWAFVGLIAAAALAYGGWRSMQEEEGTTFGAEADRVQDRVGGDAPPPPPPPSGPGASAPPPPPPSAGPGEPPGGPRV